MKKVILIFLAAIAFSCGDSSDRSSQSGSEAQTEDNHAREPIESDRTEMESDTTSSPGMDRQGDVDTTATTR